MYKLITYIFNALGMGVRNANGKPYGRLGRLYNCAFLSFYIILIVIGVLFGHFTLNYSTNLFTMSSFWFQYVGRVAIAFITIIYSLKNTEVFLKLHKDIDALKIKCEIFGKEVKIQTLPTTAGVAIIIVTAFVVLVLELIYRRQNLNFIVIWNAYVPGIAASVYVFYISYMKLSVTAIYAAVNKHVNDFGKNMTWNQKLKQRINSKKPSPITTTHLKEIFDMYNLLYKMTDDIKKYCMIDYIIYIGLILDSLIFFSYLWVVDLLGVRTGRGIYIRDHFFTEYWTLAYWPAMLMMTFVAHTLVSEGNECTAALHNIRSIFANISEHASVYSMQLMFSEITPNCGCFDIDFSIVMTIIGMTIKYVFIFVHFNVGGVI